MMGRGLQQWIFRGLFFLVVTLWGCEKNIPEPGIVPELRPLTIAEKALIEHSNRTAFDVLAHLNKKDPNNNLFFSPLSIGMALGMINNGIRDNGSVPYNPIMAFMGSDIQVNKAFNELAGLLKNIDRNVQITVSNSFWYHRKYSMNDIFKDMIMAYYDADAEGINFESAHTPVYINRLISSRMNINIDKVNYQVPGHYESLQINAIGFSGKWTYNPEVIMSGKTFNGNGGAKYEFIRNAVVRHFQDDEKRIIDVPYGNGQYSMTIIVPEINMDWEIGFDEFNKDISRADTSRFDLYLPVMEAQYQFNLNDLLSIYNVAQPITTDDMFSGSGPQKIDAVIQGAYLDPPLVQNPVTPVRFDNSLVSERAVLIDRPFLYFITEKHTGIVLFAGKYLNP
jgi:serine protease inhibitor